MAPLIFAALLAGTILTSTEFTFINLTCGPFWLGPAIFIKTWLIYTGLILVGLGFCHLILSFLPSLNRRLENPAKRFYVFFFLSWLLSMAMLFMLVSSDLDTGSDPLTLLVTIGIYAVVVSLILLKVLRNRLSIPSTAVLLSLIAVASSAMIFYLSDQQCTSAVEDRSADYVGNTPHVCLIVLDATRGDHLSCYGYPFPTSPNIDRIAAQGLLCRNAYSAANWTPPGHISIFTGKYPSQQGNGGRPYMPEELVSMTEILNQQGYFCVAIYNNPLAGEDINLTQGFDRKFSPFRKTWLYPAPFRLWDKMIQHHSGSKATFELASQLFEWMEKRGGHLFLYINVLEAHSPYQIREPYFSEFTKSLPRDHIRNFDQVQNLCNTLDRIRYDSTYFAGLTEEGYAALRATYDSELAYMDHHFGKFAGRMRQTGLLDSILLIITADHGEFLGEHFSLGHPKLLFNPVLKIPLIMRYPANIRPVTILDEYVSNVDILPTALDLLGLPEKIPPDVEGIDIMNHEFLQNRILRSSNFNSDGSCFSLYNDHYKLILNEDSSLLQTFPFDTLLFNLDQDPEEFVDLHDQKVQIADEMLSELNDWSARITVTPHDEITISDEAVASMKALGYVH